MTKSRKEEAEKEWGNERGIQFKYLENAEACGVSYRLQVMLHRNRVDRRRRWEGGEQLQRRRWRQSECRGIRRQICRFLGRNRGKVSEHFDAADADADAVAVDSVAGAAGTEARSAQKVCLIH